MVGSDKGIYWAVYDEIKKGFSVQKLTSHPLIWTIHLKAMRVVDIDGGSPDIIYSTNNDKHMYALGVEGEDKFSEPKELIINGLDLDSFDISVIEFMALSAPLSTNILLLGMIPAPMFILLRLGPILLPFSIKLKHYQCPKKLGSSESSSRGS